MDNPQIPKKALSDWDRWANICDALAEDALRDDDPSDDPVIDNIQERITFLLHMSTTSQEGEASAPSVTPTESRNDKTYPPSNKHKT